jgi:SmpA / OmlA family
VKSVGLFGLAPVLLFFGSSQLFAQTNDDSRVQKLEEAVRVLERRVAILEDELREETAPTPVASGTANWRKLRNGMSQEDVEQLLGSPSKVDANLYSIAWYYGYPSGGRVQFDARSRKVEGWNEP